MTTELRFTVPGQPIPRPRARAKYGGHGYYQRRRGISYPEHVLAIQAAAREALGPAIRPDDKHAWMLIVFINLSGHPLGDWDSYAAAASDALEGIVYANDRQVLTGFVLKMYDAAEPNLEVIVKQMEVLPWLKKTRGTK